MRLGQIAPAMALTVALALAGPTFASAAAQEKPFSLTPYVWLPNVEGDLRFSRPPGANGNPNVEVGPVDYLENLDMGLMLAGEWRSDRFSLFTDIIYFDFSNENGSVRTVTGLGPAQVEIPIDVGTQINLQGGVWTLAGGLDLVGQEHFTLQAFAGLRRISIDADLNWKFDGPLNLLPQTGATGRDAKLWDGLVGVRGEGRFGNWFIPYYLDVGAGSSDLTWQGLVGVGYRWGWGDLRLAYRHLAYEGDSKLIDNIALSGPAFGATFRF